jgi:Fic family protein
LTGPAYAVDLNRDLLAGSPYCFAEDAAGETRAKELLDLLVEIRGRQERASQAFRENLEQVRKEVEQTLDIRLVFESNAIENAPTTFGETRDIILANPAGPDFLPAYTFGRGVRSDPKMMEVLGHRNAVLFARSLASSYEGTLREVDVKNIHRLVMASEPRIAGKYKSLQNTISGRHDFLTAQPEYVTEEVHNLLCWMSGQAAGHTGPHVAAVVHAWLSDIHPFEDGNGRVARILANLVLFRASWPCLIVPSDSRAEYYEALAASDGSDILPLAVLFARSILRSLTELEDPVYAKTLIEADLGNVDDYSKWQGTMGRFADALAVELQQYRLILSRVGLPSGSAFQLLRDSNAAGNCWFAKVLFTGGRTLALLWFGYESAPMRDATGVRLRNLPSLFFSERNEDPAFPHPYRPLWEDPRLEVHEAVVIPGKSSAQIQVRQGDFVRTTGLREAARAIARSLDSLSA